MPCFALVVLLLHLGFTKSRVSNSNKTIPIAVLSAIVIGALTEGAQAYSSRTPSWDDFFINLLGIFAGASLLLARALRGRFSRLARIVAVLMIWIASATLAILPGLNAVAAKNHQARAFPMLGNFEEPWHELVWRPQFQQGFKPTQIATTSSHAARGKQSLEVTTAGGPWSGVRLILESSLTWQPELSLCFTVTNPNDEFPLGIRVDTRGGKRFTGQVNISSGTKHYRIPSSHISNRHFTVEKAGGIIPETIVFHLGDSSVPRRFYLDNVRLE